MCCKPVQTYIFPYWHRYADYHLPYLGLTFSRVIDIKHVIASFSGRQPRDTECHPLPNRGRIAQGMHL